MIVISDTTAISNLVQIGQLDILEKLYGEVIIPESVYHELQILIKENIVSENELGKDWIVIKQVKDQNQVANLLNQLDRGESEAIVLSLELKADYLLIDEKLGRLMAIKKQMKIIGTLGVLLESKKEGLIDSVTEKMDELRGIGFWISDGLYSKIQELESKI